MVEIESAVNLEYYLNILQSSLPPHADTLLGKNSDLKCDDVTVRKYKATNTFPESNDVHLMN